MEVEAGFSVSSRMVEAVALEWMKLDVEVADELVEARRVEALEVLEVTVEGRRLEPLEADVLSQSVEAVDADRINLDIEVAEVTVEARTTLEALGFLEATV